MSSTAISSADQALSRLVSHSAPATIEDVIARMEAIDALLPVTDGLKWFNRIYLSVTRQVDLNPPGGAWQNPQWLMRLDVVFANLYFDALRDYLAGKDIAKSWSALFDLRFQTCIDRIQFAVAGMNAHINHDLALALHSTNAELKMVPASHGPEHTDYESINTLLNALIPAELVLLATDTLGVLAQDTGKIGRVLAFWKLVRARELAWDFADHLRSLNPAARDVALDTQDALTGALSRAILYAV